MQKGTKDITRYDLLLSPVNDVVIDGNIAVFQWDRAGFGTIHNSVRVTIKERTLGQSPEEAMSNNPVFYQAELSSNNASLYLHASKFPVEVFGYVWQVVFHSEPRNGTRQRELQSEIGQFRLLDSSRVDLSVFAIDRFTPNTSIEEKRLGEDSILTSHCENGDLEQGTFQGWQAFSGIRTSQNPTVSLNSLQPGFLSNRHRITTLADGNDPFAGSAIPQVGEGVFAARLGNNSASGEVDCLAYTFLVTDDNKLFNFRYAVVLEDPGHDPDQQPFFTYYVLQGNSIYFSPLNMPVAGARVVADRSNPFFVAQGNTVYRGWTPTCLDLSDYVGKTMTIVFFTADCALGGHYGYAYLDGLCVDTDAVPSFVMPSSICLDDNIVVDGSSSKNETSHFWSVEESDENWARNPQTEISDWFIAQKAGSNFDLKNFFESRGGTFECNKYYRVKLAVNNNCTPWAETVQLLYIKCPAIDAGPDLCVPCHIDNGVTQLRATIESGDDDYTVLWSPATGLLGSYGGTDGASSLAPFHVHGSVNYPMTYQVMVTDSDGCSSSDDVTLYCEPPTLSLEVINNCCGVTIEATPKDHRSIEWSTGESDVISIQTSEPGTYSATVSNPCGSVVKTIVVTSQYIITGFFNPIAYNSWFNPISGATGVRDKLYIKDVLAGGTGAAGIPESYNATQYRLEIFERWHGDPFRVITGENCNGFDNWSIQWDGKNQAGNIVPQGVYTWRLRFKNCQYKMWRAPNERKFVEPKCIKWVKFLGIKLWCKTWDTQQNTTVDVVISEGSVTIP